jgi:hypothetical protein
MKRLWNSVLVFMFLLTAFSCQRELQWEDIIGIPDPPPPVCTTVNRILVQENNQTINAYIPRYDTDGKMTGILDSLSGVLYSISYHHALQIASITSPLGTTDFAYSGNTLTSVEFTFPVKSLYRVEYVMNEEQGLGSVFVENNGIMKLMHNQYYSYSPQLLETDYDSLGYIKTDLVYFHDKKDMLMRLFQQLQFGTELQFGLPMPFGILQENYPEKYESERYKVNTGYHYSFSSVGKLTEFSWNNSRGKKQVFKILYGC